MSAAKYINFNQGSTGGDTGFLSKIQNAGSNIGSTTIIIVVAVILFIVLAALYYFYYVAPQSKFQVNTNSKDSNSPTNSAELLFFYADW